MPSHLTVRMAWHDNNWDGKVCRRPEDNIYCVGTHSLLSDRLARNKKTEIENDNNNPRVQIDKLRDYLPPCFWSTNAFSNQGVDVLHQHPFASLKSKIIPEYLSPNAVFTWPFRLSFNHSKRKKKMHGNYPPDLEPRIENFLRKFDPNDSIVFFYLNYDNPISADRNKYVLVGCSVLKSIGKRKHYHFNKEELTMWKQKPKMQNFPTINWAIQISHDFESHGVLLPYKEYLEYVEQHPEAEDLLKEMEVIIQEEALIPSFKYVASEIDNARCIYLLTKLRKALTIIKDHGFIDVSRQQEKVEALLERVWKIRGLYPSLGKIVDILADIKPEESIGEVIVSRIKNNISPEKDLLEETFNLILGNIPAIPEYLKDYESTIEDLKVNVLQHYHNLSAYKKLCLFELTRTQLERIIFQKDNPFKKKITLKQIADNPYLLCEEYVENEQDLDKPEQTDEAIGIFKIDVGMFPDSRYLKRNRELQNLPPACPERLRAVIIEYLKSIGQEGDCYANLEEVFEAVISYPLFYKDELKLDRDLLHQSDGPYFVHFKERLTIVRNKDNVFFYLNEVKQAEELIEQVVTELLSRPDHDVEIKDSEKFVKEEQKKLESRIPNFNGAQFIEERTQLLKNVLHKSFFVISGTPGSGKTQVLKKIIQEIKKNKENVTLLAPTGKATLRLKNATDDKDAQTIDRYIYENGYYDLLEDFENLILVKDKPKPHIDNLIIDESSMVDLQRISVLFSLLQMKRNGGIKRIILVGDENQLPPIGFGRPFYDIVQFIQKKQYRESHYIQLITNCRQQFDKNILRIADLFVGNNRYYEELIEKLTEGQYESAGFSVELWNNKQELLEKIMNRLEKTIEDELSGEGIPIPSEKPERLNLLLGLWPNGHVKGNNAKTMQLDRLQLLSPYRAGFFGTLGLNENVQREYRKPHHLDWIPPPIPFTHSDKIIRIKNWNIYDYEKRRRTLLLSNGSIGIVCNKHKRQNHNSREFYRQYFFPDSEEPIFYIDDDENFELAYAITIHKSQGSEFKDVFLVLPSKLTLITKELLYTALTRSTNRVVLFLQESKGESTLDVARKRSAIIPRNTSIFEEPEDSRKIYEPKKGETVDSKIEYILYSALDNSGLKFAYEEELQLKKGNQVITIHPDFTITVGDDKYYWEHLGMLDIKRYSVDWRKRKELYTTNELSDFLVTTDDLNGVKKDTIDRIIEDIRAGRLKDSPENIFSNHHYKLHD